MNTIPAAIDVQDLTHRYAHRVALDGLSMQIGQGEIFAVLGPNGSGKTTLFRLLSTLLRLQAGSARVLGLELPCKSAAVRRRIGVVFQSPSLDRKLTVGENLRFQAALYGIRGDVLVRRQCELLDRLGLADRVHERAENLSGGLRRRVELASFAEYYFPGTLVLILLFTAVFSTISLIEDRREGFLQSVLVAPLPRWSMVLGKVAGGTLLAVIQGWLFLLLALTLPVELTAWKLVQVTGLMLLASLGLTSLGFSIAWRMESTQGFHAVMTVFLMPLWLLSGAFFPVPAPGTGSSWLQIGVHWAMRINPLTYTVSGMHQLLFDRPLGSGLFMPSPGLCWLVTGVAAVLLFSAACRIAGGFSTGDLR